MDFNSENYQENDNNIKLKLNIKYDKHKKQTTMIKT